MKGEFEKQIKKELDWVANEGEQSLSSIRAAKLNLLETISEARKEFWEGAEARFKLWNPYPTVDDAVDFAKSVHEWFEKWFGEAKSCHDDNSK